jgi:hypothetical protein
MAGIGWENGGMKKESEGEGGWRRRAGKRRGGNKTYGKPNQSQGRG